MSGALFEYWDLLLHKPVYSVRLVFHVFFSEVVFV